MVWSRRSAVIVAFAALLSMLLATDLHACSCISVALKWRFMGSTEVFVVEFLNATLGDYPEVATVRVHQQFLGTRADELTFVIDRCSLACADVGKKALIFAKRRNDGRLYEIGCASVPMDGSQFEKEVRTLRAWWWRIERRITGDRQAAHFLVLKLVACACRSKSPITGHGSPVSSRTPSHPFTPTYGGRKKCFGSAATSDSCAPAGALHQTATWPLS
jgi:hypothetical protein